MTGGRLLAVIWLVACSREVPAAPVEDAVATESVDTTEGAVKRPLQRWMSDELMFRIRAKDLPGLADALGALAEVAPPGYPRWQGIAAAAARDAAAADVEAVRRGCASCHRQYRAQFRAQSDRYEIDRLIERSRR
jgi:cytochrome c1